MSRYFAIAICVIMMTGCAGGTVKITDKFGLDGTVIERITEKTVTGGFGEATVSESKGVFKIAQKFNVGVFDGLSKVLKTVLDAVFGSSDPPVVNVQVGNLPAGEVDDALTIGGNNE
ncbi:MAG: hypothetical protein GY841_15980 [FCB group bacterium]|nr:hypothetical protein [FCB group bacterium]